MAEQEFLDGKARTMSQGKVVGGSTIVNGLVWTRGSVADFDAWERLGNPGWGWNGLLPYFEKVSLGTNFLRCMHELTHKLSSLKDIPPLKD